MNDCFISREYRPSVSENLAQEAWAIASELELNVTSSQYTEKRINLLILADLTDYTSKSFILYARSKGVHCIVPQLTDEFTLCVNSQQDQQLSIEVYVKNEKIHIHGILNRGLPLSYDKISSEEEFRIGENLATWWALVALFPGPVVNRSSRLGFIPNVDLHTISKEVSGLKLGSIFVTTDCFLPPLLTEPQVNIHLTRNGEYLGKISKDDRIALSQDEVFTLTGFDPSLTSQVLLAGNKVFDLTLRSSSLSCQKLNVLQDLISYFRSININFATITLEHTEDTYKIIQINLFPSVQQYQHIENEVNEGLFDFLRTE